MVKEKLMVMAILAFMGVASYALAHCGSCGVGDNNTHAHEGDNNMQATQTNFTFNTITGEQTDLESYHGKIVLIVNTASKCGYTKQYAGLEELYDKYKDKGLVVIGFPANNFGNQEPGSNEEILQFCTTNFDVSFPMMEKISVKGDDISPLYEYLTTESGFEGDIKWNFTKFLLDRDGKPVARFETKVAPMSDEITSKIEELL